MSHQEPEDYFPTWVRRTVKTITLTCALITALGGVYSVMADPLKDASLPSLPVLNALLITGTLLVFYAAWISPFDSFKGLMFGGGGQSYLLGYYATFSVIQVMFAIGVMIRPEHPEFEFLLEFYSTTSIGSAILWTVSSYLFVFLTLKAINYRQTRIALDFWEAIVTLSHGDRKSFAGLMNQMHAKHEFSKLPSSRSND